MSEQKVPELDSRVVEEVYQDVERALTATIQVCKSPEQFIKALMRQQLIAQRTLGVLLFNAAKSAPNISPREQFDRVSQGIWNEYLQLLEAEIEDPDNLTSIDQTFGASDAVN